MNSTQAVNQFLALKEITPKPMRLAAEEWAEEYQTLIATLLSARTRDEVTIVVAEKLFEKYPTLQSLAKAKRADVEKVIRPVNFYRNKAEHVIACAQGLLKEFDGKVPRTVDQLTKLAGVGRKTANVFLSEVGHAAVGVDVHVHKISNKMGWSSEKNPHKVESDLKQLFPRRYWAELNSVMVRFGKSHTKKSEWNALLDSIKKIR